MQPLAKPIAPNVWQLQENGRAFPPNYLHESWRDYFIGIANYIPMNKLTQKV